MSKYADMNASDFLQAFGDDAQKWAEAFCEQYPSIPRDVMVGWFANAIEHSGDVRRGRLIRDDEAWLDHIDVIVHQRRFWRDFMNNPPGDVMRLEPEAA